MTFLNMMPSNVFFIHPTILTSNVDEREQVVWKAGVFPPLHLNLELDILTTFKRGTIESILSHCITVWFGSITVSDKKVVQRVVKTAKRDYRK